MSELPAGAGELPEMLILYTRNGCELCDRAEAMLAQVAPAALASLQKRDIDTDPDWLQRYRLTIPVLQRQRDGQELRWPFPPSRLRAFVSGDQATS